MEWTNFDWYDRTTWPPANTIVLWQAGNFEVYYLIGELWIDSGEIPSIYTSYAKGVIPRQHPSANGITHWTLIAPPE